MRHPLGPAPALFAVEADAAEIPTGTDELSLAEARAASKRAEWIRQRPKRFAERVSSANEHRLKVRRISAALQAIHAERQARKAGAQIGEGPMRYDSLGPSEERTDQTQTETARQPPERS